jgi:hypothetical protein
MTGRHRVITAALVLGAVLSAVVLLAFAGNACPAPTSANACAAAGLNRTVVIGLTAAGVGFLVTPFAFLTEFVLRRRIVFRGAWGRAARRGLLAAAALASMAALRLGGALTGAVVVFVVIVAALVEWLAARRFDTA